MSRDPLPNYIIAGNTCDQLTHFSTHSRARPCLFQVRKRLARLLYLFGNDLSELLHSRIDTLRLQLPLCGVQVPARLDDLLVQARRLKLEQRVAFAHALPRFDIDPHKAGAGRDFHVHVSPSMKERRRFDFGTPECKQQPQPSCQQRQCSHDSEVHSEAFLSRQPLAHLANYGSHDKPPQLQHHQDNAEKLQKKR